jgi:glycosyltransferase involved in cell wall biosynthesis
VRVGINLEQLLFRTPGGVGRYTARLATLLPALFSDDDYTGFVARHSRAEVEAAGLPIPTAVLPLPRPVLYDAWHILGAPRLSVLDRRLADLDVIHAPSVAVPPRGRGTLVVTVHDAAPLLHAETFNRRGRRFHRQGLAAAARRADVVITVSESARSELLAHTGIPPERIRVVLNGVDQIDVEAGAVADVRHRFQLDDRPYVFWVGTQEPRKNLRLLVQAFAHAVDRAKLPHALVLAGGAGWNHEPAAAMPGGAALGDRLRALGAVSDADLHALYKGAELFAFPSVHEGFGLPVLEAMAQGTPVLCSDRSSLPEVAGGAAVLVSPELDAWTAMLTELLQDAERRSGLAELGRARAAELTWERCARATHAVYEEAAV